MDRGTVESHFDARVAHLLETDPAAAAEYMLRAIPLLREYTGAGAGAGTSSSSSQKTTMSSTPASDSKSTFSKSKAPALGATVTGTHLRNDIFNRYMAEVEGDYTYLQDAAPKKKANARNHDAGDWVCDECGSTRLLDQAQSALVCPDCGMCVQFIEISQRNLSFDEQMNSHHNSHCTYKRVNHFSEWINSLQARESTVIPDDILDAVRAEFRKMRATSRSDVTPDRVKQHLKKLRLSKWYEHRNAICNALNGTPAPTLSAALETRLRTMFHEIQAPFEKWKPVVAPQRKNFLSYSFVLFKFCELLGEDELLQHFTLLKSQDKLYQMDAIWKKICGELQWEYIASV